ncbi:type II secretion system secretin GspD [Caulobacter sp. NIBR2454]|uniref:type II secretion system secretin GspD n=1 Tax=Caulobacter sp. NIBR2454 TaxID=3015996 RepID=UPI0022B67866|nr:type II secretion system secretin GspD [Caulobacter sp. NIBR2454]
MKRLLISAAVGVMAFGPLATGPALAQSQVLNLQDADIRVFIQDVARATGRTFIIDPRVSGKVSIASQEPLSKTELFEVLLSTLRANGLVAIPAGGGAYRIAPEQGAATQPSSLGSSGQGFTTHVFRLRNIDADAAAETLKPLIGAQGVVTAGRRSNTLVVADYADNLGRIRALIGQIDQDRSVIETITLRSMSAREMAGVVNDLLKAPGEESNARNALMSVLVVESSNSLVLRGDADIITRLRPVITDLDRRAQSNGDVRVVRLQHASAEQLVPMLQQLVGQASTSTTTTSTTSGTSTGPAPSQETAQAATVRPTAVNGARPANIARFAGANALVISADAQTQQMLAEVIRQLDVRREQVLVEAVVVEVSDETAKRLGVQFALAGTNGSAIPFVGNNFTNGAPSLLGLAGAAAANNVLPEDSTALTTLRAAALDALANTTGMITGGAGRIGDDALFGFIVNAVKSDTKSNLLSTPSIMTLDNQEASILVGQEVPVTTGEVLGDSNTNPFRTVQRQNVGIELKVRPQINAGGAVTLFLRQEVSSVAGPVAAGSDELVFNKREIETTVLADDGDIIVLGGLLDQNERVSVDRTPILGDVPGLGALFRSKAREGGKTNLMVFIRPRIIKTAADARAATAARYGYVRDQQGVRKGEVETDLDAMVREYMQIAPPAAAQPVQPAS